MTIITKANTDKKTDKNLEKPLVLSDVKGAEFVDIRKVRNDLNGIDVEMWLSPSARRRISTTTTVCVFITALLVMSICIIGGVYLYRQVTQHQRMSRFRGWCGIPFERDALQFKHKDYLLGPNKPFFKEDNNAEWFNSRNRFKEEFELDLESERYERIDVPDFGYGRKGRFIHDFEANKTGIIDLSTRRCFVKPLDRKHVKPPHSLFDLISKMWMGYYNIDTKVVRKTMEVMYPPIEDLKSQGAYIAQHCAKYPTFLLRMTSEDKEVRKRRHAVENQKDNDGTILLAEFAGQNIVEYDIIDNKGISN